MKKIILFIIVFIFLFSNLLSLFQSENQNQDYIVPIIESEIHFSKNNHNESNQDWTISNDTVIENEKISVYGDLIILEELMLINSTLLIENLTVEHERVSIKENGSLIMENSEIVVNSTGSTHSGRTNIGMKFYPGTSFLMIDSVIDGGISNLTKISIQEGEVTILNSHFYSFFGIELAHTSGGLIQDCTFEAQQNEYHSQYFIHLWDSNDNQIKNCNFYNSQGGVRFTRGYYNKIYNCVFSTENAIRTSDTEDRTSNDIPDNNTNNGFPIIFLHYQNNITFEDEDIGHMTLTHCVDVDIIDCRFNNSGKILLDNCQSVLMDKCSIMNSDGIKIDCSSEIYFIDCVIMDNRGTGISAWDSIIYIDNCIISNNSKGIFLSRDEITITNCQFMNNDHGPFYSSIDYAKVSLDTSNTVNGHVMYYFHDEEKVSLRDKEIHFLHIQNCRDIQIERCRFMESEECEIENSDGNISDCEFFGNNKSGFKFYGDYWSSENDLIIQNSLFDNCHASFLNINISKCIFKNFYWGPGFWGSNNIEFCEFYNNRWGMSLSYDNTVTNCYIHNNEIGINLHGSSYNMITKSNISNNEIGMKFIDDIFIGGDYWYDTCEDNEIYLNHFFQNEVQINGSLDYFSDFNEGLIYEDKNIWNNSEGRGNYWSDYNGTDLDGDGIGDTDLPWQGVDHYPLMEIDESLANDQDCDGLPDPWEMQYFGNLDQSSISDYDQDGFSDYIEYIEDTDPTDDNDPPRGDEDNYLWLIIAIALIVIIAIGIILFLIYKRRTNKPKEETNDLEIKDNR